MGIEFFHVDAFAEGPFRGNPAAVCLLEGEREAAWMQQVAAEMNLSETAFLWPEGAGFRLRWFTPTVEVPLCGHATLASAHALLESGAASGTLRFATRSGTLQARQDGAAVESNLPAQPVHPASLPEPVRSGLPPVRFVGRTADRGLGDFDYLVELEDEAAVRDLAPPLDAMRGTEGGFIVTARSVPGRADYVNRYLAPGFGIDEDPVTGAAHCALAPFWSGRLGTAEVLGLQVSRRRGRVRARVAGPRVLLTGSAITILRGELLV